MKSKKEKRLIRLSKQLDRTPTNKDASKLIRRMGSLIVAIADARRASVRVKRKRRSA
jgi:hypothetical protein